NLAVDETIDDTRVQRRVESANVAFTDKITRPVNFTRREREPANAAAKAQRHAPIGPSDEADQRGRENRPPYQRAWRPVPSLADKRPSTVMKWREPPCFEIPPGPAIRFEPEPVAGGIRRPANRYRIRRPNISVFGRRRPTAISVKVFVTDHLARDILR